MKRILLLFLLAFATSVVCAQSTVYVVFTSTESPTAAHGAWHTKNDPDPQSGRKYPLHVTSLFSNGNDFILTLVSESTEAPVIQPQDFLKSVAYVDWDLLVPTLSKADAEAKFKEILQHETIYYIDRNDIVDGKMELISMREPRKSSY